MTSKASGSACSVHTAIKIRCCATAKRHIDTRHSFQHITTTLDCIQVCAPRPPQLALANPSLLSALRSSIQSNAKAWMIGSQGAFYAYVKHPFENVSPITFCERLAKELGVLVLPAQFFCNAEDEREREALGLSERGWDRWVRFSVANVGDEKIVQVCERLKECNVRFTAS